MMASVVIGIAVVGAMAAFYTPPFTVRDLMATWRQSISITVTSIQPSQDGNAIKIGAIISDCVEVCLQERWVGNSLVKELAIQSGSNTAAIPCEFKVGVKCELEIAAIPDGTIEVSTENGRCLRTSFGKEIKRFPPVSRELMRGFTGVVRLSNWQSK